MPGLWIRKDKDGAGGSELKLLKSYTWHVSHFVLHVARFIVSASSKYKYKYNYYILYDYIL